MHDSLLAETVSRFPHFGTQAIEVQLLEKGGSDRKFYRIATGNGQSLILAKYGTQREENRHYVTIARFLDLVGVRVPKIFFEDETENLIWMEDLGERDLWSYREEPWPVRRELYRSALDQLLILHGRAHQVQDGTQPTFQAGFDADLYRWEQNYFMENCLGQHFQIAPGGLPDSVRARLEEIALTLASKPRVLVHRDFQSQNIVIKDELACFIDFQGMRPGLPQYDLASVLLDPYVVLTLDERAELLDYYMDSMPVLGLDPGADFKAIYRLCAMQRLMQALGAYGFLGLVKGRTEFLRHIPPALSNLKQVLEEIPGLEPLLALPLFAAAG